MTINLEEIMRKVESLLHNQSPAHDFEHVQRVYRNAEMISKNKSKLSYHDNSNNLTNCIDYVVIILLFSIFVPN